MLQVLQDLFHDVLHRQRPLKAPLTAKLVEILIRVRCLLCTLEETRMSREALIHKGLQLLHFRRGVDIAFSLQPKLKMPCYLDSNEAHGLHGLDDLQCISKVFAV